MHPLEYIGKSRDMGCSGSLPRGLFINSVPRTGIYKYVYARRLLENPSRSVISSIYVA